MSKIRRRRFVKFVAFYMVLLAIVALGFMQGYRINTTPSYPIGIYKLNKSVTELRIGDLVAFCPRKEGVFKFSSERGYLERGICESGLEPLVKRIVAKPGDDVVVSDIVSVNGVIQVNSELKETDIDGRAIPRADSQSITEGSFFVMSEHNPNSFDSRYFGPIPADWIYARAEPVWVSRR